MYRTPGLLFSSMAACSILTLRKPRCLFPPADNWRLSGGRQPTPGMKKTTFTWLSICFPAQNLFFPKGLAGFPTTICFAATFLTTFASSPIKALSPTTQWSRSVPAAIYALSIILQLPPKRHGYANDTWLPM